MKVATSFHSAHAVMVVVLLLASQLAFSYAKKISIDTIVEENSRLSNSGVVADEYDYEDYDDESVIANRDPQPISYTIVNDLDFLVHIYFVDEQKSQIYMFPIESKSQAAMNTYIGHTFVAKMHESDRNIITQFTIHKGEYEYVLENPSAASIQLSTESKSRRHPQVVDIPGRRTTATSVKFRSLSSRVIDIWFDDGGAGSMQGTLRSGQETTTNAYLGHVFFFTDHNNRSHELDRITITADKVFYVIRDDPEHSAAYEHISRTAAEEAFMLEYLNRTGIHWRHNYDSKGPRPPPVLYMWPAEEVGQVHSVTSANGFWNCDGAASKCQSKEPVKIDLEVISIAPRAFIIDKFLSDFEADSIVKYCAAKVKHSTVGSRDAGGIRSSDTRTSRNTWLPRETNDVTETLFRRAADALNINEKLLTTQRNVEDLQVVHYVNGQKYDAHHDWGVSGYHNSRFVTMLLYLTDQVDPEAGGETSFPKAGSGGGIKVKPVKGSAVVFYNLLEDGNGDDLALHAALPVHRGEKWLANFWVWDPERV